jgi:hypothetical protein
LFAFFPVSGGEGFGGVDNVFTGVFWGASEDLTIVDIEISTECLADDLER